MTRKHTNNRMQKKPTIFVATKKKKNHNEKTEWIINMTRELRRFEAGPKAEMHIDLLKTTLKKYQTRKR